MTEHNKQTDKTNQNVKFFTDLFKSLAAESSEGKYGGLLQMLNDPNIADKFTDLSESMFGPEIVNLPNNMKGDDGFTKLSDHEKQKIYPDGSSITIKTPIIEKLDESVEMSTSNSACEQYMTNQKNFNSTFKPLLMANKIPEEIVTESTKQKIKMVPFKSQFDKEDLSECTYVTPAITQVKSLLEKIECSEYSINKENKNPHYGCVLNETKSKCVPNETKSEMDQIELKEQESPDQFESITQYDKIFSELSKKPGMNAFNFCPFFALLTANQFMKYSDVSMLSHLACLEKSVMNHYSHKTGSQMMFETLVKYAPDLKKTDINGTTIELVQNNVIGYDHIFPKERDNEQYAVILLKNGKFFVVLHTENNFFHIRDCHESQQYGNLTRAKLIDKLNETYQFNKEIDLDGYKVEEYSNIEYLIINNEFKTNVSIDNTVLGYTPKFNYIYEKVKSIYGDQNKNNKNIKNNDELFEAQEQLEHEKRVMTESINTQTFKPILVNCDNDQFVDFE